MDRPRSRDGDRYSGRRDRDDRRGYRSRSRSRVRRRDRSRSRSRVRRRDRSRSRSRGQRRRDRSHNVMSSVLDRRALVRDACYRGDKACIRRYQGYPPSSRDKWMVDPHLYDGVLLDERYHHPLAGMWWSCWHYLRRGGVTLSPGEWLRMCMVLGKMIDYKTQAFFARLDIEICSTGSRMACQRRCDRLEKLLLARASKGFDVDRPQKLDALGECRESDAESDALTEEFASEALLASKLREVVDGAVETILGSRREEGGFKDMLVSSLILDLRGGASGPDLRAAELESEIAAAKRTRMREAELKRKLGI